MAAATRLSPRTLAPRWSLTGRLVVALTAAAVPVVIVAALAWWAAVPGQWPFEVVVVVALGWALAIGLAALALRRHVLLPLAQLQALVAAAGRGDRDLDERVARYRFGSRETAALAASIVRMADDIATQRRDRGAAVAEQQRLGREVHHRVKNSLQIISSLMSLHARGQPTAEVAQAYAAMQARVGVLTMVHRGIYDDSAAHGVDVRTLVADIAAVVESSLVDPQQVQLSVAVRDVDAMTISAGAAIPVAFVITEFAAIAVATAGAGRVAFEVDARRHGDRVAIILTADAFVGANWLVTHAGDPSARIVQGMARQVRGVLVHDPAVGCHAMHFDDALAPA